MKPALSALMIALLTQVAFGQGRALYNAPRTPWCHLDVAGTAWVEDPKPYTPKGASGVAVRTLAELAFTASRWVAPTA